MMLNYSNFIFHISILKQIKFLIYFLYALHLIYLNSLMIKTILIMSWFLINTIINLIEQNIQHYNQNYSQLYNYNNSYNISNISN